MQQGSAARRVCAARRSVEAGTVAIAFVESALRALRARGIDADPLLLRVGLAPELLHSPQVRVSASQYGALWRLIAQTIDDEFFGQDSRRMKSGSFAMLCHAVLHCDCLRKALDRALRFFNLLLDDIGARLEVEAGQARITLVERRVVDAPRVFAHETLLMLLHGLACWLIGRRIAIEHAAFAYARPAHGDEYRLMYSVNLSFNAALTSIEFDAAVLDLAIVQNESSLKQFLRDAPGNILVKYKNASSLSARIRRRLRQSLPGELPPFDRLADEFHMAPATLRRRLHEEGETFHSIRDQLRRDLAIGYLSHTQRTVLDIAHELGFAERSAFHRAFRQWTGASPGQFRRWAVEADDPQISRLSIKRVSPRRAAASTISASRPAAVTAGGAPRSVRRRTAT
jgi:AraC-like DNA-binding protein